LLKANKELNFTDEVNFGVTCQPFDQSHVVF